MEEDKLYYKEGDLVELRRLGGVSMLVVGIEKRRYEVGGSYRSLLRGIKCIWYSKDNKIQEYVFNSKDLVLVG